MSVEIIVDADIAGIAFFVFFLSILLFIAVFIFYQISRIKTINDNWQKLAQLLGVNFKEEGFFIFKSPKLEGFYRNHYLILDTYAKGSGRSRRIFTELIIKLKNPKGISLQIYPEGFLSKIGKVFGMQDITLGNENFDKRFIVKANDAMLAKKILNLYIQTKILNTKNFNLKVNAEEAEFEEEGIIVDINRLKAIIDLTIDITERIEDIN